MSTILKEIREFQAVDADRKRQEEKRKAEQLWQEIATEKHRTKIFKPVRDAYNEIKDMKAFPPVHATPRFPKVLHYMGNNPGDINAIAGVDTMYHQSFLLNTVPTSSDPYGEYRIRLKEHGRQPRWVTADEAVTYIAHYASKIMVPV